MLQETDSKEDKQLEWNPVICLAERLTRGDLT